MLCATALDAALRGNAQHPCSESAGGATAAMSMSWRKGGEKSAERLAVDSGNHVANGRHTRANVKAADAEEDEESTDTWTHLGALDVSKVNFVGKRAGQTIPDGTHGKS